MTKALNERDKYKSSWETEVKNHKKSKAYLENKITGLEKDNEELSYESISLYEKGFDACRDQITFLLPNREALNQLGLFKIVLDGQLIINPKVAKNEEAADEAQEQNSQNGDEAPS